MSILAAFRRTPKLFDFPYMERCFDACWASCASLRWRAAHSAPFSKCTAFQKWWSQTGSNRRPHACKARALPTELWPRLSGQSACSAKVVGLGRLELPPSRLSSARSNQLSYKPDEASFSDLRTHSRANHDGKGRE